MKLIHVADIHASRERLPQILKVLSSLKRIAQDECADAVIIAGDFWNSAITNTSASGFVEIRKSMAELCSAVPVKMIYGTAMHEPDGSLDVFKDMGAEVHDKMDFVTYKDWEALYIPEPRRAHFQASSLDESDRLMNEYLSQTGNVCKSDRPLVVVWHGEVKGVMYQNGVRAQSSVALSSAQLKATYADYIACGHLHLPQEVFPNCYYAGSACPVDFGETHDAGCNVVTIDEHGTSIKRVSFGFPINKTVEVMKEDIPALLKEDFTNKRVKILVCGTTGKDREGLEERIAKETGASEVRIIPTDEPAEDKAGVEVAKAETLCDKLTAWMATQGKKPSKALLKEAADMEDALAEAQTFPQHRFRLLSVDIKGGRQQKKETIHVDFSKFRPGTIAVLGANGAGKSWLLGNCHPYPRAASRTGKLVDGFKSRDSHRIVIYEDENGLQYKLSILMNATTKSGAAKYFAETGDGKTWEAVDGVDGSLKAYDKYVNETFGAFDLFVKTAFFASERIKDQAEITNATRGELIQLLSSLSGGERLLEMNKVVRENAKDLTATIAGREDAIRFRNRYELELKGHEDALRDAESALAESAKHLDDCKAEHKRLSVKQAAHDKWVEKQDTMEKEKEHLAFHIEQNERTLEDVKKDKGYKEQCVTRKRDIDIFGGLLVNDNRRQWHLKELYAKRQSGDSEYDSIVEKASTARQHLTEVNSHIAVNKAELKALERELPQGNICPTCGQPLSKERLEALKAERADIAKQVDTLKSAIAELEIDAAQAKQEAEDAEKLLTNVNAERKNLADEIAAEEEQSRIDNETLHSISDVAILVDYKPRYENHDKLIPSLQAEIDANKKKLDALTPDSEPQNVSNELQAAEVAVNDAQNAWVQANSNVAAEKASVAATRRELVRIGEAEAAIAGDRRRLEALKELTQATAVTGIPEMELRAVAPEVTAVANRILHGSYGDTLDIRMGVIKDENSKRKTDDFGIEAVNYAKGGAVYGIEGLSSGERVWVVNALYHAFAAVRAKRTGFAWRTVLMDESDGHLDSEMRVKYLAFVERARTEGGAYQTVLVTHSQEIKDVAEQVIEM